MHLFAAAALLAACAASTVERDFHIGWALANPDGVCTRPVVAVNGAWPPPLLEATVGDRLVLRVFNELGNASTSIHFHGLFQNGTNYMDGAVGVTQCAIPPGETFVYDFELTQPGTYWYHAHNDGQYVDGLRGVIVVADPDGPFAAQYDEEIVLSLSDWYHRPAAALLDELISVENPTGAEPVPPAALINDTQGLQIAVRPGQTYLVRFANVGAFAAHFVWIEGHTMRVVEVDGVWTQSHETSMLYIASAQRYSVLVTARDDAAANFPLVSAMDEELFDDIPDGQNSNTTAWLVYDVEKPLPEAAPLDAFDPLDDMDLVPFDEEPLLRDVDATVTLAVKMDNLGDGANYAFFNDRTYTPPRVPSLYSALSAGDQAANPLVYGTYTSPQVLRHGDVVEVVLNNADDGAHPFHLHGHRFQVAVRSDTDAGDYDESSITESALPATPMRRDTLIVRGNGHFVIRFRADNPGVWLFHCHIEWHLEQGLVATFIEAPDALQQQVVPADHLRVCQAAGTPTAGNAAGNTRDLLDLTGENRPPPPLPAGFTAKGYVALFFSCVAAVLGMAIIVWYGALDAKKSEYQPLLTEDAAA